MASVQIRYNKDVIGNPISITVQIDNIKDHDQKRGRVKAACKTFRYDECSKKDTAEEETCLKVFKWIQKWFQEHPDVKRTPSSMEILLLKIMDIEF